LLNSCERLSASIVWPTIISTFPPNYPPSRVIRWSPQRDYLASKKTSWPSIDLYYAKPSAKTADSTFSRHKRHRRHRRRPRHCSHQSRQIPLIERCASSWPPRTIREHQIPFLAARLMHVINFVEKQRWYEDPISKQLNTKFERGRSNCSCSRCRG